MKKKAPPKRKKAKRTNALATRSTAPAKTKTSKRKTKKPSTASTKTTAIGRRGSTKLAPLPAPSATEMSTAAAMGASRLQTTPTERAILLQPWSDEFITIRADGVIYVSSIAIQQRLTDAFGPGGWAVESKDEVRHDGGELMIQTWWLYAKGFYVSECLGECNWKSNNRQMSRGDAIEGCKSNAIARNSKSLVNQVYRTLRFAYKFRLEFGVKVKYKNWKGNQDGWRHYDDPPLEREYDICDDSPNSDKWNQPKAINRAAGQTQRREPPAESQQQGLVVTSTEPIIDRARKQIMVAMREHNRSEAEVKKHLKNKYNIVSRKQIQKRWLNDILEWIQGTKSKALEPEILPAEGDVSASIGRGAFGD